MPRLGYQSPYNKEIYEATDPLLVGMGNPPMCPQFCRDNPGMGHVPMNVVMIEDEPEPEA